MSELRWNPLLGTWTIVAANRQNRPNMPKDWCPFCPGEGKIVPEDYQVFIYPNDFPALSGLDLPDLAPEDAGVLYQTAEAKGACEVLLYSPDHNKSIHQLSLEHVEALVQLWADRVAYYRQFPVLKYVYEFENRGAEVGVTMPHPHGQLYAFPYIPLKIKTELKNCKAYFQKTGRNMFDDMLAREKEDGVRVIFENEHFSVFLPHFTDYPYGVFIVAKDDVLHIDRFSVSQKKAFSSTIRDVNGMFDFLFRKPFPFMMCMHQGTLNDPEWVGEEQFYRFHVEFYPPLRAESTIKYNASTETGAWAAANTRAVEDTAEELRAALALFKKETV